MKRQKKGIWKEIRIAYQELKLYIIYVVANMLIKNSQKKMKS